MGRKRGGGIMVRKRGRRLVLEKLGGGMSCG